MGYILMGIFAVAGLALAAYFYSQTTRFTREKKQLEDKYAELELKTQALELESIKYKLNPHLFKNTLNSIQSHAYQTYHSLDKLANVLDFILYNYVTLKEEMEFALSLIEINRLKVSPLFDLKVKNNIDPDDAFYNQQLIAPLITVDLIENAFKHAELNSQDAFITIIFELNDGVFSLSVSNKISAKPGMKKANSGFGKENLARRLDIVYKNNHALSQFIENEIFMAHLKLDLAKHKQYLQQIPA
jgi:sensor histidine kinase YesM